VGVALACLLLLRARRQARGAEIDAAAAAAADTAKQAEKEENMSMTPIVGIFSPQPHLEEGLVGQPHLRSAANDETSREQAQPSFETQPVLMADVAQVAPGTRLALYETENTTISADFGHFTTPKTDDPASHKLHPDALAAGLDALAEIRGKPAARAAIALGSHARPPLLLDHGVEERALEAPVAQDSGADDAEDAWRAAVDALHQDIAAQAGLYDASPEAASASSEAPEEV